MNRPCYCKGRPRSRWEQRGRRQRLRLSSDSSFLCLHNISTHLPTSTRHAAKLTRDHRVSEAKTLYLRILGTSCVQRNKFFHSLSSKKPRKKITSRGIVFRWWQQVAKMPPERTVLWWVTWPSNYDETLRGSVHYAGCWAPIVTPRATDQLERFFPLPHTPDRQRKSPIR